MNSVNSGVITAGIRVNGESTILLDWVSLCQFIELEHKTVYNNFKYNEGPNTKLFDTVIKIKL